MELIKGVEEFLLCGFLTYNKLDIIDQKNVYGPVLVAMDSITSFVNCSEVT